MDRWKRRSGKSQRREEKRRAEERRSEKRKSHKKEDAGARKGRKVAIHCVFPMVCGSGGSKSRLAKAAGGAIWPDWEMKNCTPLWREAHFQVKMHKTHQHRTVFGSCDVEKVHAAVARSTFPSQNAQSTSASEHFQKLRCRKSARRCGAKHIPKSKCTKHPSSGPLLEVEMSKKRTPLWHEAHFVVKSAKNWQVRSTFGRSEVVLRGKRKGLCTLSKVRKTSGFCSSFNYNHHYTTLHSTPLHSITLQLQLHLQLHLQLRYITLRYTTLCSTNYITLHYATQRHTALHYTALITTTATTTATITTTLLYTTLH